MHFVEHIHLGTQVGVLPQHFLDFVPLPDGHLSLRPILTLSLPMVVLISGR